ncbi:MAG TPA: protein phosphatase, partial [Roseiflexaceae bacterium]
MEQPQQPDADQTALVFAGRYEIAAQQGDDVTAIDRQPWKRCWACGATSNEAGELFCTECGAALDGRHYRGQLTSGEPAGLALVPAVADAAARELLPPIWDQVQDDGRTLTLVADSGR